jgi:aspartate carbamoyltransferase regulatory subunit
MLDPLCLRQRPGLTWDDMHKVCKPDRCSYGVCRTLTSKLTSYVEGLSAVIFRKENLRGDRKWWLASFYSLCLQSHARRALVALGADHSAAKSITQHLHLAAALFTAASGGYDPLSPPEQPEPGPDAAADFPPGKEISVSHFQAARSLFKTDTWRERGIDGPYDFLKQELEMDDSTVFPTRRNSTEIILDPVEDELYIPKFRRDSQESPFAGTPLERIVAMGQGLPSLNPRSPATATMSKTSRKRRASSSLLGQRYSSTSAGSDSLIGSPDTDLAQPSSRRLSFVSPVPANSYIHDKIPGHIQSYDSFERPFQCNWPGCQKKCSTKEHLMRHNHVIHGSARLYSCLYCEKTFTNQDLRNEHLLHEHNRTARKCAGCGELGHIKTNRKLCPLLNGTGAQRADNNPPVDPTSTSVDEDHS